MGNLQNVFLDQQFASKPLLYIRFLADFIAREICMRLMVAEFVAIHQK